MDNTIYVQFMKELARESAKVILPYFFNQSLRTEYKEDHSPVTEADRRAEERLRELIGKRFPSHGIIGEELGCDNPDAEFTWILDPIDGTVSFISGVPLFGTLIALVHGDKPVLGLIHQPVIDRMCYSDGQQTYLNEKPVHMRRNQILNQATLLATDIKNIKKHQDILGFNRLLEKVYLFRTWGDCYGYLLLASGMADIMIDPVMHVWDLAALIPVIRDAGGIITAWDGTDAFRGNSCVATAPGLHHEVITLLNG